MKILKAALLGRSLDHSISPEVHGHLFEGVRAKCGGQFDALDYGKIECADESEFLSQIRNGGKNGYVGFNVTFPYKYAISNVAGEVSALAKQIHSANTVLCLQLPKIISTDGDGFRFAILKSCPELLSEEYSLTILGAGGAARAVLYGIYPWGWKSITIAARSEEQARRAAQTYQSVTVSSIEEIQRDVGKQFIVQATPVGQRADKSLMDDFEWREGDIAADLVYNPLRTRFLDHAASGGATIVDGLGMLMEQASLSQHFWMTGTLVDRSLLSSEEFHTSRETLSKLLTPRWDAFAT
jgi:shikimate dehydrogenase